jgi:hypothetical protein
MPNGRKALDMNQDRRSHRVHVPLRGRDSAECLKKIKFTVDFKVTDDVLRARAPITQNPEFALARDPLNIGLGAFKMFH